MIETQSVGDIGEEIISRLNELIAKLNKIIGNQDAKDIQGAFLDRK